jgi:hypothetical protein
MGAFIHYTLYISSVEHDISRVNAAYEQVRYHVQHEK